MFLEYRGNICIQNNMDTFLSTIMAIKIISNSISPNNTDDYLKIIVHCMDIK